MARDSLPSVRPVLYEVCLEPDFKEQTFAGRVLISCDVAKPIDHVRLHCKFIRIQEAGIEHACVREKLSEEAISYNELEETVVLHLGMRVSSGETIKIDLSYTGMFNDNLEGFYQAHYTSEDSSDKEYHLAVTFMEPTYARQVFPCFDEPQFKAQFIISAVVDESLICRSNMPVERSYSLPLSKRFFLFEKSPPMSTYLVALIAGPLSKIKSQDSRVPISILYPYGSNNKARFALNLARKGLELFEGWFDSMYPLPKLDMVAVPDFCYGGEESWGLIMFNTTSLLLDPEDSPLETKQSVTDTVLHEIAHMWVGNLVTMKYWDGLWLKEGFATLMSWLQSALESDSLVGSHPVEVVLQNDSEAKQIYDDISYDKGCCILRMVSKQLGWENFLSGVKLYIDRHQYGNTESEDLWTALEDTTGVPIKFKMDSWTKTPGFPVVRVIEVLNEGTGELTAVKLNQERFLGSGVENSEASPQIWPLNIGIRFEEGVEMFEMHQRELVVHTGGKSLLKVNADHDGFFRTLYSPALLQKLIQAATEGRLTRRDIIGLSCDFRALVCAGFAQSSTLLELSLGLKPLTQFLEWDMIGRNLRLIHSTFKFSDSLLRDAIDRLAVSVFGSTAYELGWSISEENDEFQVALKSSIFGSAGFAGDTRVIEAAREMFSKRISGDEDAIDSCFRLEVFGIVAKYGGERDLEALLDIWNTSANEGERYLALRCLGRASNAELVRWVLSLAFTKTVEDKDICHLIRFVGSSAHGASELWEWFKANWDRLRQAVPTDLQCSILDLTIKGLGTAEHIADVRKYFAGKNTEDYKDVLDQKLERMEIRRRCAERDADNVRTLLASHGFLGT